MVTDLEKSKGKYQYVKKDVDPEQLADEIRKELRVDVKVWWYAPDELHIDTDVGLTAEQKATMDDVVARHVPKPITVAIRDLAKEIDELRERVRRLEEKLSN